MDAALEARKGFQALLVRERQQLHQNHAGDVARGIDPEMGVGKPCPGEAAGPRREFLLPRLALLASLFWRRTGSI